MTFNVNHILALYFIQPARLMRHALCSADDLSRLISTTRVRPDPHGLLCGPDLRETPLGPCGSPTKSVRVRAGQWNLAFIVTYVDGKLRGPVVGRLYAGDVGTADVAARQPRLPAISGTGVTARRLTSAPVNHTVTAASVSAVIRGAGSTQTYSWQPAATASD